MPVIDDYGHHPVEIAAVLKAARAIVSGKVIAVVQPHRYSRISHLFDDLHLLQRRRCGVLVADMHAAGEEPIEGVTRDALVAGLNEHGHRMRASLRSHRAAGAGRRIGAAGDIVVCLGAGSITG